MNTYFTFTVVSLLVSSLRASADPNIAASFDCDKASTVVEQAICKSDRLAELDTRLARAFKAKLARTTEARERASVRTSQRAWLRGREEKCMTADLTECLAGAYRDRLAELSDARPPAAAVETKSGCASGQPISIDLQGFREALVQCKNMTALRKTFSMIGERVSGDASDVIDSFDCAKIQVKEYQFNLTDPKTKDRIIAVEIPYPFYGGATAKYVHIAALKSAESGRWCVLGQVLDQIHVDSYRLEPVHVLSPDLNTIELTTTQAVDGGEYEPGPDRSYLAVEGGSVRLLLSESLGHNSRGIDGGSYGNTAIKLTGGFPKEFEIRTTITRRCIGTEEQGEAEPRCSTVPTVTRRHLVFRDGKYVGR